MASPSAAQSGPDKHEDYWFESGNLILLVNSGLDQV